MPADTSADHLGLFDAAFQLHRLAAGFLEDAAGALDRPIRAEVEAGERHVDHHQGVADGPADHFGVIDHLFERHRQGGAMALDDHRQAVAHQDAFDAGRIDQAGHGVVVGGQHGDFPPGRFHGRELGDGNLWGVGIHSVSQFWKARWPALSAQWLRSERQSNCCPLRVAAHLPPQQRFPF